MKLLNYILAVVATVVLSFMAADASAKVKMVPKVYMYGFSASFNDSTVYFTDVMSVDSAWIETKSQFLMGRADYAQQLKSHFNDNLNMPNRTCIVIYGLKRGNLEKKYSKLRKMYANKKKNNYDVRVIAGSDFAFKPVNVSQEYNSSYEQKPSKKERKRQKDNKRPGIPDGMPPTAGNVTTPPRM